MELVVKLKKVQGTKRSIQSQYWSCVYYANAQHSLSNYLATVKRSDEAILLHCGVSDDYVHNFELQPGR